MCLIIERKPNFELPFEKFKTAIDNNPDGFGISYPEDGKLQVIRSHKEPDPDKLYRLVNEELKDVPLSIHLRYNTVGSTILRNAHPFPILEKNKDGIDIRMAHNGTLGKYKTKAEGEESDTRAFVRLYVRPLFKRLVKGCSPEELLSDTFIKDILEDQLTSSSVLSFIDSDGNTLTCNETGNGGKREEGWWYSNTYSFNPKHRVNPTTKTYPTPTVVGGTTTAKAHSFSSCSTPRFTKRNGLKDITDCFNLSDETIKLISENAFESRLLIKELLMELQVCKGKHNVH